LSTFYNCSGLAEIHCKSETPIDLSENINVFYGVNKETCTLYVPKGSYNDYKAAAVWQDFLNIIEEDETAIPELSAETIRPIAYYNLQGQQLAKEPDSGIYIVKYDNGAAKKVLKK
jgi:hypothetical protein